MAGGGTARPLCEHLGCQPLVEMGRPVATSLRPSAWHHVIRLPWLGAGSLSTTPSRKVYTKDGRKGEGDQERGRRSTREFDVPTPWQPDARSSCSP